MSADLDAEISNSKAGRLRLGLWELEHCRDKERLGLGKWQASMNLLGSRHFNAFDGYFLPFCISGAPSVPPFFWGAPDCTRGGALHGRHT